MDTTRRTSTDSACASAFASASASAPASASAESAGRDRAAEPALRRTHRTGRGRASVAASATALVAALTLTGAALTGCSPAGQGPGSSPSSTAEAAAETATLPDTPLGEQAAWVLAALNEEIEPIDIDAGIPERFSAPVLEQLPADELRKVFEQLAAQGPWRVTGVQDGGDQAVITIRPTQGDRLDMQIVVDPADGDRVAGLLFGPSAADRTPSTSWEELEETVDSFAADTTLVVTEVEPAGAGGTGTTPDPALDRLLATGDPADPRPSGSIFKLYVLGAVADQVAAGALTWETPLTITDDLKSLPSGELQNEPSGTTVTVQEAAEKMIAISDNTATDLLMQAVGPDALATALADLGHHDPALNTPMPTTRALFQLGWGSAGEGGEPGESREELRERWASGSSTERRAMLDALPGGLVTVDPADLTDSVWQHGLDWFTSADDLTAAHLGLQQKAATEAGAPIRDILAANSGLSEEVTEGWSYVAFKGGSSIGVLAGSWYLERASDGRAFVISIQGSSENPADLADMALFFGQVEDAVALLPED
jgi:hypothetical protein